MNLDNLDFQLDSAFQSQLLNSCPVCQTQYGSHNHLPTLLPSCSHTICSTCLDRIFLDEGQDATCPFDNIKIGAPNRASNSLPNDLSPLADLSFDQRNPSLDCTQPQIQLYDPDMSRVEQNSLSPKVNAKPSQVDCKEFQNQAHSRLEQQKRAALYALEESFREFQAFLVRREEEVWSDVVAYSLEQRTKGEEKFRDDQGYREHLSGTIVSLSDKMHERFFQALDEEIAEFETKLGYDKMIEETRQVALEYHEALGRLDNRAGMQLKDFQPVFPPIKSVMFNEIVEEKLDRVREILQFEAKDEWLVISSRNLRVKGNRIGVQQEIQWGEIERLWLKFERKGLSKAGIQAINYIWSLIGPVREIKMDLSNGLFGNGELEELSWERFWITEKIEKLEIALKKCNVGDEAMTRLLSLPLTRLPGLRHLTLNLRNTRITDVSVDVLNRFTLPTMMNLESFQLYLSGTSATDKSIIPLCGNVKHAFTKVKLFNLCLRGHQITQASLASLASSFSAFKNLENLTLSLINTKVDDASLEKLNMNTSILHSRLHTFSLNLTGTNVSNRSIENLSTHGIAGMDALQNFSLYLSETRVGDSGLKNFFKFMNIQKKQLRTFVMTLNKTSIGDKGIKGFNKFVLPFMKSLETFNLDLFGTGVSDKSVLDMLTGMKHVAGKLKHFSLGLVNTRITNKSIVGFATSTLPGMQVLESFTIALLGTKVNDSGVTALWRNMLVVAADIKTLVLELGKTDVTDACLVEFATNILPIAVGLENLTLGFSATKITDEGIFQLAQNMKELETLVLALSHTGVTDRSMIALAGYLLPHAEKLNKFEINLHNTKTSGSTEAVMGQVLQQVSKH